MSDSEIPPTSDADPSMPPVRAELAQPTVEWRQMLRLGASVVRALIAIVTAAFVIASGIVGVRDLGRVVRTTLFDPVPLLLSEAYAARSSGNLPDARDRLIHVWIEARDRGDRELEIEALQNLGDVERDSGDHQRALEHYLSAQQIFKLFPDLTPPRRLHGLILVGLGEIDEYRGYHRSARGYFTDAAQVCDETVAVAECRGFALVSVARQEVEFGNLQDARRLLHDAYRHASRLGSDLYTSQEAKCLSAEIALARGDMSHKLGITSDRTQGYFTRAETQFRAGGPKCRRTGAAYAAMGTAGIKRLTHNFTSAHDALRRAGTILLDPSNPAARADLQFQSGLLAVAEGDFVPAEDLLKEASVTYRDLGSIHAQAAAQRALAMVALKTGRDRLAYARAVGAEALYAVVGCERGISDAKLVQADLARGRRDFDEACRLYREVYDVSKRLRGRINRRRTHDAMTDLRCGALNRVSTARSP